MKMESWKLATLLAVGVAADSYLEAFSHSQSGGSLPPQGVVFSDPSPQGHSHHPVSTHNNYLPIPQNSPEWYVPYSTKPLDLSSIIPIGISVATVLKLILKFLIFKTIVKFIAVICALLVLPKLEKDERTTSTTAAPEGRGNY